MYGAERYEESGLGDENLKVPKFGNGKCENLPQAK